MKPYRSPYEAYPFLCDADEDLRCDFEILTDRMASCAGLLASLVPERREEVLRVEEMIYHANPTLRTFFSVTGEETEWLKGRIEALKEETAGLCERFVLPAGTTRACVAHVLRADGKALNVHINWPPIKSETEPDGAVFRDNFNVIVVYESTPVLYNADGSAYADWSFTLDNGTSEGGN